MISYANGQIVPTGQASIPIEGDILGTLRGLRVFSTLTAYGDKAFHLSDHVARLLRNAKQTFMSVGMSQSEIESIVLDVLAKNVESHPDTFFLVRIILSGGDVDESGFGQSGESLLYVTFSEFKPFVSPKYETGAVLASYPYQRYQAEVKYLNYVSSIVAHQTVVKQYDADFPLFVSPDEDQLVREGSTFNVFGVRNGVLFTPAADGSILKGITRRIITDLAAKVGYEVHEIPLYLLDLMQMDEVFITSSTRGALGIVRIDDTTIGTGEVGPVSRELLAEYQTYFYSYFGVSQ